MTEREKIKISKRPVVVLCAGEGKRLLSLGKDKPKAMLEINNQPVISHVLKYWMDVANKFIFIVGYKKESIISYLDSQELRAEYHFVEQKKPAGIADAVNCAGEFIDDDFIVVLGDCICNGYFEIPEDFKQGVGVWETDNINYIKQSYSVELTDSMIAKVVEKPREIENNYCGMGYYFFKNKVFDYIKHTEPSNLRNEVEITDVIQNMINNREEISPLWFKGGYINVTSEDDVKIAKEVLKCIVL